MKRSIIIILVFCNYGLLRASEVKKIDLHHLDSLEGEAFKNAIHQFYDSILIHSDYQEKKAIADELFSISKKKNKEAHIESLLFKANHLSIDPAPYFNDAYAIANNLGDIDLICKVDYSRSQYYLQRKKFDSAVYHILKYQELTRADISEGGYQNITEFLGNVYYQAGLFEQASSLYLPIYHYYQKAENWNHYRPYVMMNNLGQIALRTGDFEAAQRWLNKSLQLAQENLNQDYRENTISYIKIKLAETALLQDELSKAEKLLKQVSELPASFLQSDVQEELLFYWAKLKLKQGFAEEAEELALQLLPNDDFPNRGLRFVPEIYILLAQIEAQIGNDSSSVHYYQVFHQIEDSLKQIEHLSRSMILLAQKEIETSQLELKSTKKYNKILIIILLVTIVVFVSIFILYRKLVDSRMALVKKSLPEQAEGNEDLNNQEKVIQTESLNETLKQKELIKDLLKLMKDQKPYLEHGICINQISEMLSTNRTYLSKAINQQLNTSFPNLVNEYRIKEAILLITSGYAKDHTQEALAKLSGFSSRNVFTNAFKKQTGVLPSFFIANYQKLDPKTFIKAEWS